MVDKFKTSSHVKISDNLFVTDASDIYQIYLKEQGTAMSKLRSSDYTVACFGISQGLDN